MEQGWETSGASSVDVSILNPHVDSDFFPDDLEAAEHAAILTGSRGTNKVENYYRERIVDGKSCCTAAASHFRSCESRCPGCMWPKE